MIFAPRISTRHLAQLCRRMGMALQAGIDIRTVVDREAERGPRRQRAAIARIREQVAAGQTMADTLAASEDFFPPLVVAMVQVSESTGKMAEGFLRLADHYDHRLALRRAFLTGISWPLIQLFAAICIVGLLIWMMGFIANFTGEVVDILGWGLVGTRGLMIYLSIVLGAAMVFVFVLVSATRGAAWTRPFQRLVLALPVVGRAIRTVALARCAWALSLVLDTAMDARRAVRLALMSTSNPFFARHAAQAEKDVESGNDLTTSLRRTGVFPDDFLDALATGEQSGRAAESMSSLADDYEQRAKSALATLTMVAGVVIWIAIFGLIIAVIARIAAFYFGILNDALDPRF